MPTIEIEVTDEEAEALLGIDKPSPDELAEEIRRRVLEGIDDEVSASPSDPAEGTA